jgi:hypothetical protein
MPNSNLLKSSHCECSFANDSFAFEDFERNPQNSSLALMLPCIDDSISDKLIAQIGGTIQSFIIEFDFCITMFRLLW